MQAKPDYSEANPDEVEPYGMDFVNDLLPGETIETAAVTLIVAQGTDPDPQGHVSGDPGIVGTKVSQVISKLLGEVKYCVLFTVTTSLGNTLELYSHVYCKTPI